MREIKFRAWDGIRMYHFENHEWTLDYNDISGWNVIKNLPIEQLKGRKWDAGESSATAEQFQLMQFTGLHDKNGIEIYEGDVCWTYEVAVGNLNRIVSFDSGAFVLTHPLILSDYLRGWKQDYIEVIGNIYQNPELLKPTSK